VSTSCCLTQILGEKTEAKKANIDKVVFGLDLYNLICQQQENAKPVSFAPPSGFVSALAPE
jgi:hypothetical protein